MSTKGVSRLVPGRLVIGLMSGTSHDGVDAALARTTGSGPGARARLLAHSRLRFPASLRASIRASMLGSDAASLCALNFALGEVFARAAIACARKAGVPMDKIDAIASHGQTICHIPPGAGRRGSTLQIGAPAVIARKTGVPVVSDFRSADMAAGGHGAPLVPFADYVLFGGGSPVAAQNIGGIANVTLVTPRIGDVAAFDTGPGNCLMDEAALSRLGRPFDPGGRTASRGRADEGLLRELLGHPYFSKRPPKSTGREMFGGAFLEAVTKRAGLRTEDLLCTLSHLTAWSIALAYERFIFPKAVPEAVVCSGGGMKNRFLMGLIRAFLRPVPVRPIEDFGIPSSAKEAMSFAILANETLEGNPANLPGVTGASRPVVLGSITRP